MPSKKLGIEMSKGRIRRTAGGFIVKDTRKYYVLTIDGVTAGTKAESEAEARERITKYLREAI